MGPRCGRERVDRSDDRAGFRLEHAAAVGLRTRDVPHRLLPSGIGQVGASGANLDQGLESIERVGVDLAAEGRDPPRESLRAGAAVKPGDDGGAVVHADRQVQNALRIGASRPEDPQPKVAQQLDGRIAERIDPRQVVAARPALGDHALLERGAGVNLRSAEVQGLIGVPAHERDVVADGGHRGVGMKNHDRELRGDAEALAQVKRALAVGDRVLAVQAAQPCLRPRLDAEEDPEQAHVAKAP